MDLAFPTSAQEALGRICSSSSAIPLQTESVDLVVWNHALEHFQELDASLFEVDRILKKKGALWLAVPEGSC